MVYPDHKMSRHFLYFVERINRAPITAAEKSKSRIVFKILNAWIVVRIPVRAWIDIRVISIFVLSCISGGLAMGRSHVQGVLPNVQWIHISEVHSQL
jgi:hypothetical protein